MKRPGEYHCVVREYRSDHMDCLLRLYVLAPGMVRVRYAIGGIFDHFPSYGVSPEFTPMECEVLDGEDEEVFHLSTSQLRIRIRKYDLGVEFYCASDGCLLSADADSLDYSFNDWTGDYGFRILKSITRDEFFFGLGDKPCDLNLRGKRFEMWGADHYAFKEDSDPLYKNITFFLSLFNSRTYGIFLDNTCKSFFDFGAHREDILSFGAEGGIPDYYFIHGDTPLDVIASYTRLTGLASLPPMWALGYHQSKWSYYPDKAVINIAETMRNYRIPCDVIHLDIHHMDSYRSMTWDTSYFPDPSGMMDSLAQLNFRAVVIVNPGVKIDREDPVWQSGFEQNCFCRRHDGALMDGVVWPGLCHFPDFTAEHVRIWWKGILRNELEEVGISGIWNDMNEPVIFPDRTFPMDTRHDFDAKPCSHNKAHNVYGHCMAAASWEAMLEHGNGRRPFNLTRSGYSGMQRFAATWTGDNCSAWEHMRMADFQCQRLAASGVSFAGSDAGGFLDHPSPEMFTRWMQMASFHLFFRNHSSGEYGGQEPWSFDDETTDYVRSAIENRYRLLPYLYTYFHRYAALGYPVIRSLALQCHDIADTYWRGVEFFLGDHLYVVPILHPGARGTTLFVPEGDWYNYWTGSPAGVSARDRWFEAPLDRIPVFVRGGAVIPRWPVQQYTGEIPKDKLELDLDLWWSGGSTCQSYHYEDAGEGFAYKEGEYLLYTYEYSAREHSFELLRRREGGRASFHGKSFLAVHSLPSDVEEISLQIDGEDVGGVEVYDGECRIALPENFSCIAGCLKMASGS